MIIRPPTIVFETDKAGQIIYPVDNGEPLSNDTEHLKWITFLKNGLEDWYGDRTDVFVAGDLLWYPIEGRPDICKAPDVMVVLDHAAGERPSYQQWNESNRPPDVVFEFISKSNTAGEMMDKLEFYSDMGCSKFFIYDYRRGHFLAFAKTQESSGHLIKLDPAPEGTWTSQRLGMVFGLDEKGKLWVRRPDGKLMETQKQIRQRADAETQRAASETQRADRLAAKLRELGLNPDEL